MIPPRASPAAIPVMRTVTRDPPTPMDEGPLARAILRTLKVPTIPDSIQ